MLAIAHRGYSSAWPENTAAAFAEAAAAGADVVETDVRFTADGVAVCWHDADLARVTGRAVVIAESELDALKAVPLPRGQTILTLEEALAILRGAARVLLDVKVPVEDTARRIAALVADAGMTDQVIYGVRARDHLAHLRRHAAALRVLAMPGDAAEMGDWLGEGVHALRLWEDEVTAARAAAVHGAGAELWVTAGARGGGAVGRITPARLAALARMGVDGVLLDDPTLVSAAAS